MYCVRIDTDNEYQYVSNIFETVNEEGDISIEGIEISIIAEEMWTTEKKELATIVNKVVKLMGKHSYIMEI